MALFDLSIPSSLFYRNGGYSVGEIQFHLLLKESHMLKTKVTEHSIEDGSAVADHIYNELQEGSLTGFVSNFGLKAGSTFGTLTSLTIPTSLFPENAAQNTYDELRKLRDRRVSISIVTSLQVYDDVVITQIAATRDGETGDAQGFDIRFKEIRKVHLESATIEFGTRPGAMITDLARQAAGLADVGKTL